MSASVATYYDILRVSRTTAPEDLRFAYRSLAQKFHPDKLSGHADAVRVMSMINEAYAVLSDPERRARYDRWIEGAEAARSRPAPLPPEPPQREATWPWYLLFATLAFTMASIGTVIYKTTIPAIAAPVSKHLSK
jgi:curved DNA-binding protein CbpA